MKWDMDLMDLSCLVLQKGGVTSMDDFLLKFFPDVYEKRHNVKTDNYCLFDSQVLTLFTSSLYLAALLNRALGRVPPHPDTRPQGLHSHWRHLLLARLRYRCRRPKLAHAHCWTHRPRHRPRFHLPGLSRLSLSLFSPNMFSCTHSRFKSSWFQVEWLDVDHIALGIKPTSWESAFAHNISSHVGVTFQGMF